MALPGPRQVVRIGRDGLRTQVWPLPTIAVVLAVAAGVLLPQLDKAVGDSIPFGVKAYLFGGGAEAARSVLNAIASSQITVTSLTFSLTVVTLQLASSQFSPRLLRTFSQDRFVHVTLAMFLATFTYALTVLRTVRTGNDGQDVFVPQISVTFAFLLVLASVIGLVLFLAHLAREIRVETMLKKVHSDATGTLRGLLAPWGETRAPGERLPTPPIDAWPLLAPSSGFLTSVDDERLLETAVANDVVVWLDHQPGGSLIRGAPMGAFWPFDGADVDAEEQSRLHEVIAAAVQTGFERTPVQDVGFGLRQLTDVANKALSPGINDPTTAVHALDHSSALQCELIGRELGPRVMRDDDDRVRVVLRRPDLAVLLELALSQPRRYGASDPLVLGRIASLLRCVGDRRPRTREIPTTRSLRWPSGALLPAQGVGGRSTREDLVNHALHLTLLGAAAGAAGTTALNALTYLDMTARGRPSSSTPETTVERLSEVAHVPIPGDEETRENRVSGLGPLTGQMAGVGIGALLGLARAAGWRPAIGVSTAVATVGAMVGTSGPMTLLGITDPRTWPAKSWVVDIVPHLAYGAVTAAVLERLDPR